MITVFDETVEIAILRDGEEENVPFCELLAGDIILPSGFNKEEIFVAEDAHYSGDSDYDGYLFYDVDGCDWYPEDFGAEIKEE